MATVFYSWQADTARTSGKNLIENALKDAIKALKAEATVDEAERPELEIDRDTLGVAGSPPIMDTIFAKIDAARAFVADLTFVGKRTDGERLTPNPNVLIEYGWALKSLGYPYIIGVMNVAHGDPDDHDLPFDLGHLRRPIRFECPIAADDATRAVQRKALAASFTTALRATLALSAPQTGSPAVGYVPIEPKDGRARFRAKGQPIGVREKQEAFPSQEFKAPTMTFVREGSAMWLRLLPSQPVHEPFKQKALAAAMSPDGRPIYPLNSDPMTVKIWRTRSSDGFAVAIGVAGETPIAVTQAFSGGEIWSFDTHYMAANRQALILQESHFVRALREFAGVLGRLGIAGPYSWIAGMEGAYGRSLILQGGTRKLPGDHHCATDVIEVRGNFSGKYEDADEALSPFFETVFDQCGVVR